MSTLVDIRHALYQLIATRLSDPDQLDFEEEIEPFVRTDFELIESYAPRISLPELNAGPRVTLIGLGADQANESRSRIPLHSIDQPVQVALQAKVKPDDTGTINTLITLHEQLQECARLCQDVGRTWLRTEALKDRNGTPYEFMKLRQEHTFESIFTAYYRRAQK